jgi:hypothetical protein
MTLFDFPDFEPRKASDPPAFHNTSGLRGADLVEATCKSLTQEERITKLFLAMPDGWTASPEDVHRRLGTRAPLTSIRRAMTNLTRRGVLLRTDAQRTGQYGRPVYLWRAA